jgi:hypothetical protein
MSGSALDRPESITLFSRFTPHTPAQAVVYDNLKKPLFSIAKTMFRDLQ